MKNKQFLMSGYYDDFDTENTDYIYVDVLKTKNNVWRHDNDN